MLVKTLITSCQLLGYGYTSMKILGTCKAMMNMYLVLTEYYRSTECVTYGTIHNKYFYKLGLLVLFMRTTVQLCTLGTNITVITYNICYEIE